MHLVQQAGGVFVFVIGSGKHAKRIAPAVSVEALVHAQFSVVKRPKIVAQAYARHRADAVRTAAHKKEGTFPLLKQISRRQRKGRRAFFAASRKRQRKNVIAVLRINKNIGFALLRAGGKIQLFKYAQVVQIVLRLFVAVRSEHVAGF